MHGPLHQRGNLGQGKQRAWLMAILACEAFQNGLNEQLQGLPIPPRRGRQRAIQLLAKHLTIKSFRCGRPGALALGGQAQRRWVVPLL